MTAYDLAQLNIARPLAPLTDASMADFVAGLPVLNAMADSAPGFVWRLQEEGGTDATGLRPFGPDIMVNMSVWTSVEALRAYAYRTAHLDWLRRRREWFTHEGLEPYQVLWWVPAGEIPTVDDAWARLQRLRLKGSSPEAFTFREPFPPPHVPDVVPSSDRLE